jgi:hypothetical protein
MGWKASCIFVNQRGPGYLGTFPKYDQTEARDLVDSLPLPPHKPVRMSEFDEAISPRGRQLFVGAYPGAAVICHESLSSACMSVTAPNVVGLLQTRFGGAPVLAITLHSVVNLYGYAYFEDGKLRRVRAGTDGKLAILEFGEPLPEELPLLDDDACGEEIVFAVAQRFFDAPIDEVEIENLELELFERAPPPTAPTFWQRLFGRRRDAP